MDLATNAQQIEQIYGIVLVRAFGVALRGVEQSKTPAYFGWKCGVPIQSGVPIRSAIHNSGQFWIGVRIALQKFRSAKCPGVSLVGRILPISLS